MLFQNWVLIFKCTRSRKQGQGHCLFKNKNKIKSRVKVKVRIHTEEKDNSDKVMICINTIPSTPKTLNDLVGNKSLHSSYIQTEFNDKKKMIINIFSAYVVPLLKYINHPAFLQ